MRSLVVARHLRDQGHYVELASSGPAFDYLQARWPWKLTKIGGLSAVIVDNKVCPVSTLEANVKKLRRNAATNLLASFGVAIAVHPNVVITDFDPWSSSYATLMGLPLVAVDNVLFMTRCAHPPELLEEDWLAWDLMYPIVDSVVPFANRYLVTTFVAAPISRERTTLHLPILRDEILQAKGAATKSQVVAYFNDKADHATVVDVLKQVDVPFRVYGRRSVTREVVDRNVTWCPFSERGIISDMATSIAVIGGSGFTLMTEAIYLGKPMLAMPFGYQGEQILNALYLAWLGYGERCKRLTPDALRSFLDRTPEYAERLRSFVHDGNRELLASVDEAIREAA